MEEKFLNSKWMTVGNIVIFTGLIVVAVFELIELDAINW